MKRRRYQYHTIDEIAFRFFKSFDQISVQFYSPVWGRWCTWPGNFSTGKSDIVRYQLPAIATLLKGNAWTAIQMKEVV